MSEFKPISKDLRSIRDHYTVVVVGSGYGGGVSASRLARAGQSVCLLERGREILPGEYPDSLSDLRNEVQVDSAKGHLGAKTAMFDFRMNEDVNALVGCGLGGTSLINANVALETDPELFSAEHWPATFKDPTVLSPYYTRAKAMLGSTPYPEGAPPLNKVAALEKAAKALGKRFYRPPINVNFEDQVNAFGVTQKACVNCGDCTTGCNYGAKNTTLMNYLPDAHNHGAEIFTRASVRAVTRSGDRWTVDVQSLDPKIPDLTVTADVVVLAAGTLGSTEILARSKAQGLEISPALGKHFSGNGDALGFGYNNFWSQKPGSDGSTQYEEIYGVGAGANALKPEQMPGPCIAGIIDMRDNEKLDERLVIEEGVIPGALATLLTPIFFFADAEFGNFLQYGPQEAAARLQQAQRLAESIQTSPGQLTQDAYQGPVARTQTYLVMSVDHAAGELALEDDRLRIHWPGAGRSPVIANDNKQLRAVNEAIEGQFIPNVLWSEAFGYQLMTVHPVGGCRMADCWAEGVVDDGCRVYKSEHERHDGLYVCDGSVLPGAVGVNPLLTITALAERACEKLAEERGWTIDFRMKTPQPVAGGVPAPSAVRRSKTEQLKAGVEALAKKHPDKDEPWWKKLLHGAQHGASHLWHGAEHEASHAAKKALMELVKRQPDLVAPGFAFTETMHGFFTDEVGEHPAPARERISDEFEIARGRARAKQQTMSFRLTISNEDMQQVIADPHHPASVTGSVSSSVLSAEPMEVRGGRFQLLPVDPDRVETWLMVYDLPLARKDGKPLHFRGKKYLHQEPGSSAWTQLTTLYVTVTDSDRADARVLGRGVLTLDLDDLLHQASTLAIRPRHDWIAKIPALERGLEWLFLSKFAGFFGMVVMQSYGGLLADLADFPATEAKQRKRRAIAAPTAEPIDFQTPGGAKLRLTRYAGGDQGPVVLAPGFSVRASSFAIDTVDQNVVEYLTGHGYDVWLFDYRASPDSGSSTTAFDIDDIACEDWPAAIGLIRDRTGRDSVQAVAHCVGSMSLLMGILAGKVEGVRSILSSQLTVHPVTNWLNDLKADANLLDLIRSVGLPKEHVDLRDKIDICSSTDEGDKLIDTVVWNIPVPAGEECKNPVCRRISAVFGPSYTHAQLNHATHVAMLEMFGEISTVPFQQLSRIIRRGVAEDRDGENRYLPHVRRLDLPITFFAGSRNQIFFPETSRRTYDWLVAHNGPKQYRRRVFEGYAHMDFWIGRNASRDIFPAVLEALQATG